MLLVFNKVDRLDAGARDHLRQAYEGSLQISAATGDGVDELLTEVARALGRDTRRVTLSFDQGRQEDREAIERLYRVARVLSHDADGDRVSIEAEVPRRLMQRLQEGLSL
jgi:50S ribosomal subunit-associated GTPase HflX